jgi:hypothetical protein
MNNLPNSKLRNRFSVEIETTNPLLVEAYSIMEQQLVSFDIGTENLGVPMISHVKSSVILWLQDDKNCLLMQSLRKIQQAQDQFSLTLNMLNDYDGVIEQYTFSDCRCSALQHSILSYETSSDSISLKSEDSKNSRSYNGTLKASSARDTVMKLLQVEFGVFGHRFLTPSESYMLQTR